MCWNLRVQVGVYRVCERHARWLGEISRALGKSPRLTSGRRSDGRSPCCACPVSEGAPRGPARWRTGTRKRPMAFGQRALRLDVARSAVGAELTPQSAARHGRQRRQAVTWPIVDWASDRRTGPPVHSCWSSPGSGSSRLCAAIGADEEPLESVQIPEPAGKSVSPGLWVQ